ncbi:MAG: hypothetical protein R3F59_17495 [Myxococcota bacterium]
MASVYLVPGFFGFANLGDVRYFGHVERWLSGGCPTMIHVVVTCPTASLLLRVARLARTVAETSAPDEPVHLVGHLERAASTAGCSCRLGAPRPDVDDLDRLARRKLDMVATPHWARPRRDPSPPCRASACSGCRRWPRSPSCATARCRRR